MRELELGLAELEDMARGCAILGSGGGGDVGIPLMQAEQAIGRHGPIEVLALGALDPDVLVMPVAGWGAPTVGIEKFGSGDEGRLLREAVERRFGSPVGALMAGEIGGGNGLLPITWAGEMGLPVVDADGMGRAFPEGPQCAMHIAGRSAAPAFFAEEHGNVVTIEPIDGDWYERLARTLAVVFGGAVAGAEFVMDASAALGSTIPGSVTKAMALGGAVRAGGVEGLLGAGAIPLVRGKVIDLERRTTGGFAVGHVVLEGTGGDRGRRVRVEVQNENLLAMEGDEALAMVPDLITLVDEVTGEAVPTERVRFGQRLHAIGLPCDPVFRTELGLEVAGPAHFAEIPALISVSLVYINEIRQGEDRRRSILFLILLNSQWLHLFWITDEFVLQQLARGEGVGIPAWLAWVAILIDYAEVPVIVDTVRKMIAATRHRRLGEFAKTDLRER